MHDLLDGLGVTAFCRGYGVCLAYFAQFTVPNHLFPLISNTMLLFPYTPWHHLPAGSPAAMEWARICLLFCGIFLALGIIPRACLLTSAASLAYLTQLDRTFYNNHYILMIEICVLLLFVDDGCLRWPWMRSSLRAPAVSRWQLRALELLLLTPYFFGALAKLNRSWLLDAQPVLSWADEMLGKLNEVSDGRLGELVDVYISRVLGATDGDAAQSNAIVIRHFAFLVSYTGLVLDFAAPIALFCGGRTPRLLAATACLLFNVFNKLWFGLGVFPWLNTLALVIFILPSKPLSTPPSKSRKGTAKDAKRQSPPQRQACFTPTAVWPRRLVCLLAIPHALIPLRHLVFFQGGKSSLWTDEGHLYAWHMKLVERTGWLVLTVEVRDGDGDAADGDRADGNGPDGEPRLFHLVPETDTALHPDQAGELAHNPGMLLHYAAFLREAFTMRGARPTSIRASGSCVSANGRAAQPLFRSDVDLLQHVEAYTSLRADLSGDSGVGTFLHPWIPRHGTSTLGAGADPAPGPAACDLFTPPSGELQQRSDEAYRWLYGPLLFQRPSKHDWPFGRRGRRVVSRLPSTVQGRGDVQHANSAASTVVPDWAVTCSFVHAAGPHGSVWCPKDSANTSEWLHVNI